MANLDEYIRDSGQMINAQTYMEEIANKLNKSAMEITYAVQYVEPRIEGDSILTFLESLREMASVVNDLSNETSNLAQNLDPEIETAKGIEHYFD